MAPDVSVSEYARIYLARIRYTVRPQSAERYRFVLEHYLLPQLGTLAIQTLNRQAIRDCLTALLLRGLTPQTVRHALGVLSQLLNDAIDHEVITTNPAARLGRTFLGKARKVVSVYSPAQLELFVATARRIVPTVAPVLAACALAGLRVGEAIGLESGDVDLAGRQLRVRQTVRMGSRVGPTKSGDERVVDMTAALVTILAPHVNGRRWLAPGRAGPIGYTTVRGAMRAVCAEAELPQRSPHALRHTYGSLLVSRGVPLEYVRRQLGHASIKITADLYGRWLPMPRPGVLDEL